MRKILLFISLCLCWYILSGRHDTLFLLLGIISIGLIFYIIHRMRLYNTNTIPIKFSYKLLLYAVWLIKEIISSSYDVARVIWTNTPKNHIKTTTIWLPFSNLSDIKSSLYAHSITLTPGTVCLDITEDKIKVHLLNESYIIELTESKMMHTILEL